MSNQTFLSWKGQCCEGRRGRSSPKILLVIAFFLACISAGPALFARYKARPYAPLPIESYPASLVSEGLTIAVDPLVTDALAAKVFDKKDIVSKGIIPLAIVVVNSNSFAVDIDGSSIEVIVKGEHIRPLRPEQAFMRVFRHTTPTQEVTVPSPIPLPRVEVYRTDQDALDDFTQKHFGSRRIEPNSTAAGFIYLQSIDLTEAQVYIPELRRLDSMKPLMFFEIDLQPALKSPHAKK